MLARRDFVSSLMLGSASANFAWGAGKADPDWRFYGGDSGASRYSALDQITRKNVANLKPAWTHHTEDASQRPMTTIECTPLVVDGIMYLTTARVQVRAIKAATGEPLWNFAPFARQGRSPGVNRGITWFADGKDKRVFAALQDKLFCLNPATGELIKTFGDNGIIDLATMFDKDMKGLSYRVTSPAVIFEDTIVVGGGGGEGPRPEAPGHIRGYDVYTGKRKWIFHTIPHPGEYGHNTWPKEAWQKAGSANNWAGMSVDPKRGWVFIPTGSATFDFWGGDRHGDNLFANCVLVLDARNGNRVWHYQTVHHDVWDYDLPAQPALITIPQPGGGTKEAAVQVTKTGFVFVFDRVTGKPIFPIEERKIPASDMPDEKLSPTQPFPVKPRPLSRLELNEDLLTDISPEAHEFALKKFKSLRGGVPFAPPSLQGTIFSPGTLGGALWGGCSYDPALGRLFVNTSELPSIAKLVPGEEKDGFRYRLESYAKFVDHEGYPGVKPPWGHLTAIDMKTGDVAWREVVGEYLPLKARGVKKTGSFQLGGSIATAGGLVFVAATADEMIRAFDAATGAVVWEYKLPSGGYATPCTYAAGGKQYVAIACGGGNRNPTPAGDSYVAFSL